MEINPIVRVHLSRLNLTDRLDIKLTTPYGLSFGNGNELYVESGKELAFILRNGSIYLYMDGLSLRMGDRVYLRRYANSQSDENTKAGFYRANFEPLYLGDLSLSINEGKLYPVLSIHVENYLLGVVPYEMSDSFPLEALKAQTVAARTYVLRKVDSSKAYDVVDTTNDQVFKGYLPGFTQTETAVMDTWGICGFYKGRLAQCYYSASNGGQTELVQSVWPSNEDFGYYSFGRDPYDVENPASTVRSFRMEKQYSDKETAPYGLRKLLSTVLAEELSALGYDPAPESIRVHQVSDVVLDTPSSKDSLHLTRLSMRVSISGRTRKEAPVVIDPDQEEVYLFETPIPQTVEPTATPAPTQTPAPVYGEFELIPQPFSLQLPVFKTVENAFALNISGNFDNEIWTLVEDEKGYELQARRYGHGVGMSQRGAEWMAGTYDQTHTDILGFYYPGMELMRFTYTGQQLPVPEQALAATAGPAPTVTPRPTLMPVTQVLQPGQWYAVVTEISEDSSLNLRSRPDLSSDILMRLYKNQRLLVVQRCPEEGWVQVQTDSISGYVMESYLTIE
ncbi:MAG: SpoIID/LytB domain-containing protein [Clostridia bacterium]|nr:SpoIID/LytB domain-containing protein [Clostridia bacterium]